MTNEVQIFNNDLFGEVRFVKVEGKEYAVASDVAKALGYAKPNNAIAQHCRATLKQGITDSLGRQQEMSVIPEGDIYRLIVRSKLPQAEKFEVWVFDEVLPQIRKTGGYVNNEDLFINTYLDSADEQTKLLFRATLETVRKQNETIKIMTPKAGYFDQLVDANLLLNFRDTAKELHIKEGIFIQWLIENGYVYRDSKKRLKPMAIHVPKLFEIKEYASNNFAGNQTLVTPKGRETFRLLLKAK